MNPYVLEMKGIEKSFGVPVLKGVDFSLEKGEYAALIGHSGSGKSTPWWAAMEPENPL